jgi:tetratricopeptide (TPR) repeat protein
MALAGILCCAALAAAQQTPNQAASVPASQATSAPASRAASAPASQAASAPGPSSASAPAEPSEADLLAADSLRHSVMSMVYARWGTQSRAGRLVALAAYAQKLAPADLQTAWIMSNIYEGRGEAASAEEMMWRRFQEDPNDFELGVRYLGAGIAARTNPDERQAFLQSVADNTALPKELRAQAIVEQAKKFMVDKDKEKAMPLFTQSLQLDPYHVEALRNIMNASDVQPSPEESVRMVTDMLRSNPRNVDLLKNLLTGLMSVGLHEQAIPIFDVMWEDTVAASGDEPPSVDEIGPYFNALMDAGMYDKAVQIVEPLIVKYPTNRGLTYLMIEAYRALGQSDKADRLAQQIVADIESRKAGTQPSLTDAAELAWIYTMVYPNTEQALLYARQLVEEGGNNATVRRILGTAEILSGQADLEASGRDRLEKNMTTDPIAATALVEYYLATGNEAAVKDAITAAVGTTYNGWAYRRVRNLLAKSNIAIPPHPDAEGVRKAFEQFDKRFLDMGHHPEKYLSVTMRAVTDPWQPGQGVEIEATLTNRGDVPLPLGSQELIKPAMTLEAVAPGLSQERFTGLPMVIWPAPKYLAPGASVRTVVRLDVGSLEYFLARHPLDDVTLTVTATLDLVQQGRKRESSVPTVQINPLTLRRQNLLDALNRGPSLPQDQAYPYALRVIMTDLVRGTLPQRMRAARQLGELVTLARDIQLYKARLPDPLKGIFNKPVLLAMVKKAIQDPSEAVRAEMLAALDQAQVDDSLVAVVLPAAQDASPLVRFRLVELLGASGLRTQEKTLEQLALDNNPQVRQMAWAFGYGVSSGRRE